MAEYRLTQTGSKVQEAITKSLALTNATSSTAGLMSGTDKAKLDSLNPSNYQQTLVSGTNIATINGQSLLNGGNITVGVTVDSALSPTSTNPVQNKVIKTALDGKQATLIGAGTGQNIKTINSQNILGTGNIDAGSLITVDSALSSSSTNPVQNKVINTALGTKANTSDLSSLAPKSSPAFTGTPTAPTASAGTNTTQIATTAFVTAATSGKQDTLVGSGTGQNIKTINNESILGTGNIVAGDPNAVKFVSQILTTSQQAQARANINAASLADINNMDYVTAVTRPTASASTMGHIYLIGPDANDNYDRYITQESGGNYTWVSLGSTQIDISTCATKTEVTQLEQKVNGNLMTPRAKNALLAIFEKVAFAFPDVSAEMDELNRALFTLDEVTGINAVYTQGSTLIWSDGASSLDDLRTNLVVKAEYGDGTEVSVYDYTLSGTLTTGTSVITVGYEGFTTTFNVAVTQYGNKMQYTMAEGTLFYHKGSVEIYMHDGLDCLGIHHWGTINERMVFPVNFGTQKMHNQTGELLLDAYAIKIPYGAKNVITNISGNAQQIGCKVLYLIDGHFYRGGQSGYPILETPDYATGTNSLDISSVSENNDAYLFAWGRRVNNVSYTNNEPTAIEIIFSNE